MYLHTQCTGEHTGCLVKVFQPIGAPVWAQLAPAFLRVSYTPVRSEVMLSSAPTSHNSWSRGKALAWSCMRACPRAVHPHSQTVQVLRQFFLPRRHGRHREQFQAAQPCQRHLPLHGRTGFAPRQRGGRGTQHAAAVEEALSQPLMLPTVLEQRDGLAFISSHEEHIPPALSSSHMAQAQAQLCCK